MKKYEDFIDHHWRHKGVDAPQGCCILLLVAPYPEETFLIYDIGDVIGIGDIKDRGWNLEDQTASYFRLVLFPSLQASDLQFLLANDYPDIPYPAADTVRYSTVKLDLTDWNLGVDRAEPIVIYDWTVEQVRSRIITKLPMSNDDGLKVFG